MRPWSAGFRPSMNKLLSISRDLVYEKNWNPQEMEFTFEGSDPGSALSVTDP